MAERERYQPKHGGGRGSRGMTRAVRRIITVLVVLLLLAGIVFLVSKLVHKGGDKTEKTTKPKQTTTEEVTLGPNDVAAEAKVLSTGDVIIHKMLLDASADGNGGYSFDKHYRAVKDEISAADYAVVNLEVTLGDAPYKTYPTFKSPDSTATALKNAGFDCFVMANNHCYDSGFDGLKRTVSVVNDLGVDHTGTRNDLSQKKYVIADVNGIKIGIVNYAEETKPTTGTKSLNGIPLSAEAADYVNSWYSVDKLVAEMTENVKNMKADGAEAIILYIHWGVEYSLTPSAAQKDIAQKMCDLGVDVIIGGHPHVIQPAATLTSTTDTSHHTFVAYSVGNLLSNQRTAFMGNACPTGHSEDGIFVYTTFTRFGDDRVELTHVDYSPLWVNRYAEDNSFVYEITNVSDTSKVTVNADAAAKSKERTEKLVAEGFKEFNDKYGTSAD
ncbi:MAG: CapA family protein [Clostridia bacterium]|nr:CapA family protein [Clostridia bacterium]